MKIKAFNFFLTISLILSACVSEKQPNPTILGIEFGSSYEDVWSMLFHRFNSRAMEQTNRSIWVNRVELGNFEFDYGDFRFQTKGYMSYLSEVELVSRFGDDKEGALEFEQELGNMLRVKYKDFDIYYNKDGKKRYKFGVNPKDDKEPLGVLGVDDENNVFLIYGPIYYLPKSSDF